jgi:hypothetical protein
MQSRDARLWYEAATKALFRERYDAIANFTAANQQVYYSSAPMEPVGFLSTKLWMTGIGPSTSCGTRTSPLVNCSSGKITKGASTA